MTFNVVLLKVQGIHGRLLCHLMCQIYKLLAPALSGTKFNQFIRYGGTFTPTASQLRPGG